MAKIENMFVLFTFKKIYQKRKGLFMRKIAVVDK